MLHSQHICSHCILKRDKGLGLVANRSSVASIFAWMRVHPRTTRTAIANDLGLSKATVSEAVGLLMAHGLVQEVGKQEQERGRRQVVLELQAATRLVVGVQFSENGCHAVLTDLLANEIASTVRPLLTTTPEGFVDALVSCVEELSSIASAPIVGVGVGVPGLVSPNGRDVIASVPYGWNRVPMADILEPRLGVPVIIANRAKAAALGEFWHGNHPFSGERHQLAHVLVGSGIVAGFVMDGELFFGSGGSAGEIGHTTIEPNGPLCGCGNQGCLHMLASESAIIRSVRARSRHTPADEDGAPLASLGSITIRNLVEQAQTGNELVLASVAEAGAWLGIAIANLVNLMNPSVVVVGGSVAGFGEPLLDAIRTEVRKRALWDALDGVAIVSSTLGDNAGTIGAAALYLSKVDIADLVSEDMIQLVAV